MKLSTEQIRAVTKGAVRVCEEEGMTVFHRFTEAQEQLYSAVDSDFYMKCFATAGVRLEFFTSSKNLKMTLFAVSGSSRKYFNCDVYVDGEPTYSFGADRDAYRGGLVTVSGECQLTGEKEEKKVVIYLPWSVTARIVSLELDDDATLTPVEHARKMIIFGDSITQGYDAANPSESYASLITDALDAESINKGIGGEKFRAELASLKDDFQPDIITVAYGTNDWSCFEKEEFDKRCEDFYNTLSAVYPAAKIFALTPIWRGNCQKITRVGSFEYVADKIKAVCQPLSNVTVIDCTDFVPHDARLFSYDVLHPNFLGFKYYGEKVAESIERLLK